MIDTLNHDGSISDILDLVREFRYALRNTRKLTVSYNSYV